MKKIKIIYWTLMPLILLICVLPMSFAETETFSLSIKVTGGQATKGNVIASVFTSPENFLQHPVLRATNAINSKGEAEFEFKPLTPGTYAISAIYDENSDGKLNTGFLGIPTELVGFSNNARGMFGPPTFQEASFLFPKTATIEISLGKAKD